MLIIKELLYYQNRPVSMKHIEGRFQGCQNYSLYYQCWLPPAECKAVLLLVHGLAEHSGRYYNLVNHFVPRGYAFCCFDCQGHGQSEGLQGYVNKYSYYLNDLKSFKNIIRNMYPNNRVFILGHSVGGNIAATFTINHPNAFDGLIVSGGTIKPGSSLSRIKIATANLLSIITPKIGIETIDASTISRDRAVVDAYINDPLVYRGKISARLGAELIKAMRELKNGMPQIRLPILIMHGANDRLCDPEGSLILYERISSEDKTLKLYEGFYHEIFNEPDHKKVLTDMEDWLAAHI